MEHFTLTAARRGIGADLVC